jgi:hypothetical protein
MFSAHHQSWRRWLFLLAGTVLSLFMLVAVLPRVISSQWVYGALVSRLEAENFRLTVGAMKLRWFSPLRFESISIEQSDRDGLPLLTIREVVSDRGLLSFLLSRQQLGRWILVEPVADVRLFREGSNVEDLLNAITGRVKKQGTVGDKSSRPSPAIDVDVAVKNASVVVHKEGVETPLVVVPPWDVEWGFRSVSSDPTLRIEPTRWLDSVQLTPELMNLGLELAIPALSKAAWIDGSVSLDSGEILVPLSRMMEARAECVIRFHSVRAGLQKPEMVTVTKMLAQLVGRESNGEVLLVDECEVVAKLEDGYVHHEGTKFGLPGIDSRLQVATSGRVGISDRSLDLVLEFPVPLEWLARTNEVRDLGVPTVSLPVTGTLDDPKVEWMAMRKESAELLSILRSKLGEDAPARSAVVTVLEGLASGSGDEAIRATADLLGQLREMRAKRSKSPDSQNVSPGKNGVTGEDAFTGETENPSRGPLRDLLRRRLSPASKE